MNLSDNILFSVSAAKQLYLKAAVKQFNREIEKASKAGKCSIIYDKDKISKEFNDLLLSKGYAISSCTPFDVVISW